MGQTFRIPEFKILLSGQGRRVDTPAGTFAVYPVVMLVEGVHQGAGSTPVYYSPEVLEASASHWEGMPVPIFHPTNNNGEFLMCTDPSVREDWCVGHVQNVRWEDEKLKADVYIDVVLAEFRRPGLLASLDSGSQMEVSTGLLALDDGEEGAWQAESYNASITNIIPDHLALLPGGRGACSFDDGCGIRANTKEEGMPKGTASALLILMNSHAGAESKTKHKRVLQGMIQVNELSHDGIANQLWDHVDSLDTFDGDGNFVKIHFVQAIYDDYYVYSSRSDDDGTKLFRQDYTVNTEEQVEFGETITPVREDVKFVPITANSTTEDTMSEKTPCCPEKVDAIIANENSAFTEDDREGLLAMEADTIEKIMTNAKTVVPEKPEPKLNEDEKTLAGDLKVNEDEVVTPESYLAAAPPEIRALMNAGLRELDGKRAGLITKITANKRNTFTEETLKAMDVTQLEAIANLAASPSRAGAGGGDVTVQVNEGGDVVEEPYIMQTLSSVLTPSKENK